MVSVDPPADYCTDELDNRPKKEGAMNHISLPRQSFSKERIVCIHRPCDQDESIEDGVQKEDDGQTEQPRYIHAAFQRITAYACCEDQEDATDNVDHQKSGYCNRYEKKENCHQPRPHAQCERRWWSTD